MRELYLLRHADALINRGGEGDFDRKISARGKQQCVLAGRCITAHVDQIDGVLCSSALRARQTLQSLGDLQLLRTASIQYRDEIYEATVSSLLDLLRGQPRAAQHLLLIGHNPGISGLIQVLGGRGYPALPTAGLVLMRFQQADWESLGAEAGELFFSTYT